MKPKDEVFVLDRAGVIETATVAAVEEKGLVRLVGDDGPIPVADGWGVEISYDPTFIRAETGERSYFLVFIGESKAKEFADGVLGCKVDAWLQMGDRLAKATESLPELHRYLVVEAHKVAERMLLSMDEPDAAKVRAAESDRSAESIRISG